MYHDIDIQMKCVWGRVVRNLLPLPQLDRQLKQKGEPSMRKGMRQRQQSWISTLASSQVAWASTKPWPLSCHYPLSWEGTQHREYRKLWRREWDMWHYISGSQCTHVVQCFWACGAQRIIHVSQKSPACIKAFFVTGPCG